MNIENLEPEVIVLFVGILVAILIMLAFIGINAERRTKLKQDLQKLELAGAQTLDQEEIESFNVKKEKPFLVMTGYVLQVMVGIALLIGFSGWAVYMVNKGLNEWAIVSAVFALLGVIIPVMTISQMKKANIDREQILQALENYSAGVAERTGISASVTETKETNKSIGEQEPILATLITTERWVNIADMIQHYASKDINGRIPQDSTLKRHFMTHLLAEIESDLGARPTDSSLRRHYDAMIDVEVEKRLMDTGKGGELVLKQVSEIKVREEPTPLAKVISEPVIEPRTEAAKTEKLKVPEDSTLRRHFLTQLRAEIESRFPVRPTDSTLRRHYESMIATEMDKYLAQ